MQLKGAFDTIVQPLYDTVQVVTGVTQLTFFQIPVGQGTVSLGGAVAKTLSDTNMDIPGQLPTNFSFSLAGFRLAFQWNFPPADLQVVLNAAVFRFQVGQKDFLRVPARTIPSGNGPWISGSPAVVGPTQVVVNSGWQHMANNFGIKGQPLQLIATENFAAFIIWPSAQTFTATTFFTVYLDGYLTRPVQ